MPDPLQGSAATQAPANAEAARLDAQLEIAAKKAALRNLEAQAQGGDTPAAVVAGAGAGTGSVTVTIGDKTVSIENPTEEQLAQLTGVAQQGPPLEGWQAVAVTSTVMWALVAIVWMVLRHRRRHAMGAPSRQSDEMAARIARIENAVDSIAVEVERISEGQRFTTRLLSEGAAVPLGAVDRADAMLENRGNR